MAKKNNIQRRKNYHSWVIAEANKEEAKKEQKKEQKNEQKKMEMDDDVVMSALKSKFRGNKKISDDTVMGGKKVKKAKTMIAKKTLRQIKKRQDAKGKNAMEF